jgi:integrase
MSVYSIKGKGWRYDFTLRGVRYTNAWFKTKKAAQKAEMLRKEAILKPHHMEPILIDMDFLTLANKRLDHVKGYDTPEHYRQTRYHVQRWMKKWNGLKCSEITQGMIEAFILERSKVSAYTANKELRYLRALFNFGIKRKLITHNPASDIEFLPEVKKRRYVPPKEDVLKVISAADPDTQDYLWTMTLTAARMGEINALSWEDVNFKDRFVTLWTRKRKGGNRESRDIPMISKLYDILKYRYRRKDPQKPWVFWHTYWSRRLGQMVSGPYTDRNKIMKSLCKKAGIQYFRFHPFRHFTASILDDLGVPIGTIQRILGHQNRRTTEGYLHSIGEAERNAMRKLEDLDLFKKRHMDNRLGPTNGNRAYWLRKVERPDHQILCKDVDELGYVGTGKKYGVSDNAIRKWMQSYPFSSVIHGNQMQGKD